MLLENSLIKFKVSLIKDKCSSVGAFSTYKGACKRQRLHISAVVLLFVFALFNHMAWATINPKGASDGTELFIGKISMFVGSSKDYGSKNESGKWYDILSYVNSWGIPTKRVYIKTDESLKNNYAYNKALFVPKDVDANTTDLVSSDRLIDITPVLSMYFPWPQDPTKLATTTYNYYSYNTILTMLTQAYLTKPEAVNSRSYLVRPGLSRYEGYVNIDFRINFTVDQHVLLSNGSWVDKQSIMEPATGTSVAAIKNASILATIPPIATDGSSTTPSSMQKEGYYFDGWYTDRSFSSKALTNGTQFNQKNGPFEFYGRYLPKVKFDYNNGTGDSVELTTDTNYFVDKPADPSKLSHIFVGWFRSKTAADELDFNQYYSFDESKRTAITEPTTLYAGWVSPRNLKITLTDTSGSTALSGARFNLYDQSGNKVKTHTDQTLQLAHPQEGAETQADGTVTLYGIEPGTYTLKEDYLPAGYLESKSWTLEIKDDGSATLDGATLSYTDEGDFRLFSIALTNNLIAIPSTGGERYVVQATGVLLVLLALYIRNVRSKGAKGAKHFARRKG